MKKLSALLLVAVLCFSACGDSSDSKDKSSENLGESQSIDSQDLRESMQDSHDNLDESAQKDSPKDLQFDADKNLNYRTVPCKEQLDGYSFTAPTVAICESETLKEYEIQSDLQSAYKEFIAKYMDDKKPFKDSLPTQNLSYEYDDFDRYNVSILVTYEIINPNFVMISVGYENGVKYFGFRQVDSNLTLIEVQTLYFVNAF